ncbi:hypothetical protein EV651_104115 [Kribbella sp. VKM Ac-2571]|nr:hypothetical protein EV651_104115 [Kribbella sp. VKM Ac-2571]
MYWPGYSNWSSTEQGADESVNRRPADAPAARTPIDPRPEPEDPFASYSPELRAHMLHDDTLARLQYLSPPNDEAESTSHDAITPSLVESPDDDERTSEAELPDDAASDAVRADESNASTTRLVVEASDEPVANLAPLDKPAADSVDAATKDQESAVDSVPADGSAPFETDDVAARIDSESASVAGLDETVELEHEFIEDATPEEMDQYRRIREADDLDALAEHSGLPRDVIEEAKQHLFQRQHDVAIGPDDVRHGYFTPFASYGDLWEQVASGAELTDRNRVEFWSLLAHEYVESKLMKAGLPYLSADPGAWDEYGMPDPSAAYPSAHNTAPLSTRSTRTDLLILWDTKLKIPRDHLQVADDLSNLEEVVRVAKEGLGL